MPGWATSQARPTSACVAWLFLRDLFQSGEDAQTLAHRDLDVPINQHFLLHDFAYSARVSRQ
jgi:hypothetical protein